MESPVSELGDMLRDARREKGLSLDDVAAATRIKSSFLAALEDGEFSTLPGPAYIVGFLRNYAGFLGLHPDDVVQEYYTERPLPEPSVKAATRVLANGYQRQNRAKLFWVLAGIVIILAGAYAIKQYNDASAHVYTPVNVTAGMAGGTISPTPRISVAPKAIRVSLQAIVPVWVRVTVDGHRAFQGMLRTPNHPARWTGHHSVYVMTYNGSHLQARYDGRRVGRLAAQRGVLVDLATSHGWQRVS